MSFVRARQPEQKEQRRMQVLDAAREMLAEGARLQELSLHELARRARMTKSNVYRYFETREAVFLALLQDAWLEWMGALPKALAARVRRATAKGRTTDAIDGVVEALVRTLAARPELCMLTAALPTTLEQNVGPETVWAFKEASRQSFELIADYIILAAPVIPRAAALQLLHDGVALLVGLYPVCFPAPSVELALAGAPELQCFRYDFATELRRLLGASLRDLVRRHASAHRRTD